MGDGIASALLEREKTLLTLLQDRFPLVSRPFGVLAEQLGCSEQAAIDRTIALKEAGIVRQIGGIFDTRRLGYVSALIAFEVEPPRLDAVADVVSRHPGVSHNYARDYRFNLWFTLGLPPGRDLEHEAARLADQPGVRRMLVLPMVRAFKIDVRFDLGDSPERPPAADSGSSAAESLSPADVPYVRALQNDLPLAPEAFRALAAPEGIDEVILLEAAHRLQRAGIMRRYGATLRHRLAGFEANAMACWEVPAERVEAAGCAAAEYASVSHCYQRPAFPPDWPFQLFTMLHARSAPELARVVAELEQVVRPNQSAVLHTIKEFKKVRLRYFDDEKSI
jgi:siroheme decarboxylase